MTVARVHRVLLIAAATIAVGLGIVMAPACGQSSAEPASATSATSAESAESATAPVPDNTPAPDPAVARAMLVVETQAPGGLIVGNGFAVGDGSLVVTAWHNLVERPITGASQAEGLISVLSPWLGDGTSAEIVAVDSDLDIAVIRTAWVGHPVLPLDESADLASLKQLRIAGVSALGLLTADTDAVLADSFRPRLHMLPLAMPSPDAKSPRELADPSALTPGYAGSPALADSGPRAMGCCVVEGGRTVSASLIIALIRKAGLAESMKPAEKPFDQPADASAAYACLTQAINRFNRDARQPPMDVAIELVKRRPKSAFVHRLAASAAERSRKLFEAEEWYDKAIELAPDDAHIRIVYASWLLKSGYTQKAIDALREVIKTDRSPIVARMVLAEALAARFDPASAVAVLEEAAKARPMNGRLWQMLGAAQTRARNREGAIAACQRAAELLPADPASRLPLSKLLADAGKLDEGEAQCRELLRLNPTSPFPHFWLADFLTAYRPDRRADAIAQLEAALAMPEEPGLPHDALRQRIDALRQAREQTPAMPETN